MGEKSLGNRSKPRNKPRNDESNLINLPYKFKTLGHE